MSSVFAQYMDWWPNAEYGLWSWLRVLPAFFAPAVPIMFLIDWYVIPPTIAASAPPPPHHSAKKIK